MSTPKPYLFFYRDELYLKVTPCKSLFRSTTIWEIVNRGDILAIRMSDSVLTVVPGNEAKYADRTELRIDNL